MLPVYAPLRNDGSRVGVGTVTCGSRGWIDWVARGGGGEGLRGVFWSDMLRTAGWPIDRVGLRLGRCCTVVLLYPVGFVEAGSQGSRQGHAIET
jgi:hypothetical protein